MIAGGTVCVPGWPAQTTQPGGLLPGILERMGATTRLDGDVLAVTGTGRIHGLDLDLHVFGQAPHGFALRDRDGGHADWPMLAQRWFDRRLAG